MRRRRYTILVLGLVALNLVLWLAPPGLAVRDALINQLFGPRLIRAEVVVRGAGTTTQDYLIDRGVITVAAADSITVRESDGTLVPIAVASTTQVSGPKRFTSVLSLRRNLRVLVFHLANAPASLVQVEGRVAGKAAVP
jgi:hypothetical protein